MSANDKLRLTRGFTLVEMMVIAPIAILAVTGFIALMVTMVGNVIASHNRNIMTHDIQSAIDYIEQDVRLSTQFLETSGSLPSPQGKNGATSAFQSSAGDLILGEIATDKNPVDPTRKFIYYNKPFNCNIPSEAYKNRIFFTTVIYYVKDNSLWRRTYVPDPSGTLCQPPWQVNSCAPGYSSGATRCKTNDSEIMQNVESFEVEYYRNASDSGPLPASDVQDASAINVTINGQRTAAGRTLTATASTRVTKLGEHDINLPPPDDPVVSSSVSDVTVTFTWPSVPTATSYIVQYNINGGDWITASESTTQTSFTISSYSGDTITAKILARNTTGTSPDTGSNTKSQLIPQWTNCDLQNGWVNYGLGYQECGYTLTRGGVVILKGHIRSGSLTNGVGLFRLPEKFWPTYRLLFQTVTAPHTSVRVDVEPDGWVRLIGGTSSAYVDLNNVYFIAKSSLYTWTDLPRLNGWTNFGGNYAPIQSTVDSNGRVHIQGVVKPGVTSDRTPIAQLPAGLAPSQYHHISARGDSYNLMGIANNGTIQAKGISSSLLSTQAMIFPASYGGWQTFGVTAGTPGEGQLGNGWVPYAASGNTTPQFTKSEDGIVTLKGLVKNGNTTELTFMGRLPPGHRPLVTVTFLVPSSSGAARIDIGENGWIVARKVNASWTSFDGVSFLGEW